MMPYALLDELGDLYLGRTSNGEGEDGVKETVVGIVGVVDGDGLACGGDDGAGWAPGS